MTRPIIGLIRSLGRSEACILSRVRCASMVFATRRCHVPAAPPARPQRHGSSRDVAEAGLPTTRNIGIVAHIDAGKTTTTERMLFYAGSTRRMGDVDSGTTTTDFMKEEMDRGITIQSAAVSLKWNSYTINLIDTPGHVDFTVEVERALRVVDGVVALFDAAVGVQAQSYSVLRQSRRHQTPIIAFMNKMDKSNANFELAVKSIEAKLDVEPLLLQVPLRAEDGAFEGVLDVVSMRSYRFRGVNGSVVETQQIVDCEPAYLVAVATRARHALIAHLTQHDDHLAEVVIAALDEAGGDEAAAERLVRTEDLHAAIRRCTLRQDVPKPLMPLLCGASRRDQGVQPLLDAVTLYLPSPLDRASITGFTKQGDPAPLPPVTTLPHAPTVALAFKVTHTMGPKGKRAPLVFLRVYSGRITARMHLQNNTRNRTEIVDKLYVMHGSEPREVPFLAAGQIGAAFLTHTSTGDTLMAPPNHFHMHQRKSATQNRAGSAGVEGAASKELHTLEGIETPLPVISFSIEAATKAQIPLLEEALRELSLEDPSLKVETSDLGQLVLRGMGELHLEIIMSRLEHEYHLTCRLLRAIIEYRETLVERVTLSGVKGCAGDVPYMECDLELIPLLDSENRATLLDGFCFAIDPDFRERHVNSNPNDALRGRNGTPARDHSRADVKKNALEELRQVQEAFAQAVRDCAQLGPLAGVPLHGVTIMLKNWRRLAPSIQERPLATAARHVVSDALRGLRKNQLALLEPMMEVEVHLTDSVYISEVISTLNERKAVTVDILDDGKSVRGVAPMRNVVRYTMELRRAVKGNANMYMRLDHYRIIEEKDTRARIMKNLGIVDDPPR